MAEDWLSRWQEGRTGWHQPEGNAALHEFWPEGAAESRVLVPLCGMTPDILWLADRGHRVVGVELSEIAVRAFFEKAGLHYDLRNSGGLLEFDCREKPITLICGDYFRFSGEPFDALYDRGSLIALPPELRPAYAEHTNTLLSPLATRLLVTLEYDQSMVAGPPFSVMPEELSGYWSGLQRVAARNEIDSCPPKFLSAGLTEVVEAVWLSE